MAEPEEDRVGCFPEEGRVKNVRQQWMVYEDGVIAHQMQGDEFSTKWRVFEDGALAQDMQHSEFEYKYGLNRFNNKMVRQDVPVAKIVQTEEEAIKQREEMMRLEQIKKIADEDAKIAEEMTRKLSITDDTERLQRQYSDEVASRRMLEREQFEVEQHELEDEQYARQLQQAEKEKYERKQLEREKRRIEREIEKNRIAADRMLSQYKKEEPRSPDEMVGGLQDNTRNMAVENLQRSAAPKDKNLGEDERRELQKMQDEELARLLQDQEHKRGGVLKRDKLQAIEAQDAELARIMQEQEKMKMKKRKQKKMQRQASEPTQQGTPQSQGGSVDEEEGSGHYHPQRSRSTEEYNGRNHDDGLYEQPWSSIPPMPAPPPPQGHSPVSRSSSGVPNSASGNVFAGLDPTFQRDSFAQPEPEFHQPQLPPEPPLQRVPSTEGASSPLSDAREDIAIPVNGKELSRKKKSQKKDSAVSVHKEVEDEPHIDGMNEHVKKRKGGTSATGSEDAYAEVGDFTPVAGQKRNTLNRKDKSKKGSCKQQ